MAKVKALMYTISTALILSSILSFAFLIYDSAQSSSHVVLDMSIIDKMDDMSSSLLFGMNKLVDFKSGIKFITEPQRISFIEEVNNTRASGFNDSMTEFKRLVEVYGNEDFIEPVINVTIDGFMENMSFLVSPYDILYTHQRYGGSHLVVQPSLNNFNAITINMNTPDNISECICPGGSFGNDINIKLIIDDSDNHDINDYVGGSCCPGAYTYDYGLYVIESTIGYGDEVTIQLWNGTASKQHLFDISVLSGKVDVQVQEGMPAIFNITYDLIVPITDPVTIESTESVYNITYSQFLASKGGKLKLIE